MAGRALRLSFFVILSLGPGLAVAQTTPANPDRVFGSGSRALSSLRLLEERAVDLEYPAAGTFSLIGTMAHDVTVLPAGSSTPLDLTFARSIVEVGWGWEYLKFGLFWDGIALGQDTGWLFGGLRNGGTLLGGDYAASNSIVIALALVLNQDVSLTLAVMQNHNAVASRTPSEELSSLSPLVRARALGLKLELGFPKEQDSLKVGAILGSLEVAKILAKLGALTTEGGTSSILGVIGGLDTLVQYYAPGSNPYILDLARENVGETDIGLELRTSPTLPLAIGARGLFAATGDAGLRRGELDVDYVLPVFQWRLAGSMVSPYFLYNMIPFSWVGGFVAGMGSPGVTNLGLNARAFVVRLDDGPHFGFSAGLRLETFVNYGRLKREGGGVWGEMAQAWEGSYNHVRAYWELRAAQNDFFSSGGLPFPDVVSFGLFYVAEVLDVPPVGDDREIQSTERLNTLLDEDRFESWTPGDAAKYRRVRE